MRLRFLYVFKFAQVAIIAFSLWPLLSKPTICGSFVNVKEPLHHGILGACKGLFLFVDPKNLASTGDNRLKIRPQLRLWWTFEGSNFVPAPPTQLQIEQLVANVKKDLLKIGINTSESNSSSRRWRRASIYGETNPAQMVDTAMDTNATEKTTKLDMDSMGTEWDEGHGDEASFCYELNLHGSSATEAVSKGSPLAVLTNRSVVAVAVALAQFLLLFAQIYLLNCLEEDNFVQKRGKLFLELFVLILGCLSWLIVFLLTLRTEFDWPSMWLCTNFRPTLLNQLIIVQIVAALLFLMGLGEGIRVFFRMRKYDGLIERMKQGKLNKYRPRA